MTPKPEIFRYVTELDTCIGNEPAIGDAMRFAYDTFAHGTPTAAKLARVAARAELELRDTETLGRWSIKPLRFWIWRDDGEPYGSIEVALDFEPMVTPVGDSLRRPGAEVAA